MTCDLRLATCDLRLTTHYLGLTTYDLLLTTYYSLPTTLPPYLVHDLPTNPAQRQEEWKLKAEDGTQHDEYREDPQQEPSFPPTSFVVRVSMDTETVNEEVIVESHDASELLGDGESEE